MTGIPGVALSGAKPKLLTIALLVLLGSCWGLYYPIFKFAVRSGLPYSGIMMAITGGVAVMLLAASAREAVACGEDGIALFERIRYRRHDDSVFMWAFDLIELNGEDLRREQLEQRKAALARLLARAAPGLRFNEHLVEEDGPLVFHHACKLGLEGIVSKRRDSPYSSGRSRNWIKSKNPDAPAVKREAKEEWSSRR